MTDAIDPKIILRIHKLLALANDGGATEAEAELAMSKAQELMLDNNLTMALLEASGGQGEARIKEQNSRSLMFVWKRELLETVAEVNFCHLYLQSGRTKSGERITKGYEIIGRQSNVVATKQMFEYLLQTVERLVVAEVGTSPQERYTKWSHSFRLGCTNRLRQRLQQRHKDRLLEQERAAREQKARNQQHPASATSNALVVVMTEYFQSEQDLNTDMLYGYEPGTTARRRDEANAKHAAFRARYDELVAGGLHPELARYVASGWSLERAAQVLSDVLNPKVETEAQRRKREAKEERANERYWRGEDARQRRENAKIDRGGYRTGEDRGASVGLDEQVTHSRQRKLGS